MRVVAAIEIDAPRQTVWGYILDPDRYLQFMDGLTHWQIEGTQRHGLGARFVMRMRIGSTELGNRIEIIEFDPPAELAWTSITGTEQRGRWRLREIKGGGTRVELRVTYHAYRGVLAGLAELAAWASVRGHLRRSLAELKRRIETPRRARVALAAGRRDGRRRSGTPA